MGFHDQPAFLNQALEVETDLAPLDLPAYLKQIEARLGRQPAFRYGPCLVDLDILLYADPIVSLPGLEIPHPCLAERAFMPAPLAGLAPGLRHPQSAKTIGELLQEVGAEGAKNLRLHFSSARCIQIAAPCRTSG